MRIRSKLVSYSYVATDFESGESSERKEKKETKGLVNATLEMVLTNKFKYIGTLVQPIHILYLTSIAFQPLMIPKLYPRAHW